MKKLWLLTLTLLFQVQSVSSQDYSFTFVPLVLPVNTDANSVVVDEAGKAVYFAGLTYFTLDGQTFNGGGYDAFLTKHSLNGSRLWTKLVGGSDVESFCKVVQDPVTSDLFLFGWTYSSSVDGQTHVPGPSDMLITKLTQNGTKIFTRLFGTVNYDELYDAFLDAPKQQLVVSGKYNDFIVTTTFDMNNGSMTKLFPFPTGGWASGIVSASTGSDCFVSGYSGAFDGQVNSGARDIFLTKMSYLNGSRFWTRAWGTSFDDLGQDVQYDPVSHFVFVSGYTTGGAFSGQVALGGYDAILLCARDNGTLFWLRQFGNSTDDFSHSLAIHDPTGNLYVVGYFGLVSAFVATYSQNGTRLQMKFIAPETTFMEIVFGSSNTVASIAAGTGSFTWLNFNASLQMSYLPSFTPSLVVSSPQPVTWPTLVFETWSSISPDLTPLQSQTTSVSDFSSAADASLTTTFIVDEVPNLSITPVHVSWLVVYVVIAIAVLVLVLVLLIVAYCFIARPKSRPSREISKPSDSTSDTTTSDYSRSATETQLTAMTTLIRSNFELSLPGYLLYANGPSFRITTQLAKGGGGVVSLADAFLVDLAKYGPTIIVKTVGPDHGTTLLKLSERQQKSFKQEVAIMHYFREKKRGQAAWLV